MHRRKSNRVKMGIFDSVKKASLKAKLNAEIALLDRDITSKQGAFGVDLYDKLVAMERGSINKTGLSLPGIFHANEAAIHGPFDAAKRDIRVKQNERDAKELEIEKIGVDRERAPPPVNSQQQLAKAGSWMSSTSTEAKLTVQIKLLDREINQRKQLFGVEVFDLVVDTANDPKNKSGISTKIAAGFSKLQTSEKEIQETCRVAKREVNLVRAQKEAKLREIAAIDDGVF